MIVMESKHLNILAIFAHPDDISLFCGGTIAKWVKEGHDVFALCCTSGNVGTFRTDLTKDQVAEKREEELKTANEILGIKETLMLGYPDAGFINGSELREKLIFYIRYYKADRVITFDPWVSYEVHPDHLIVGRMAAEAGAFAGFPLLHPEHIKEGIEPYACSEVWFMGLLGHSPNCYVDISTTFETKVEALLKFEATFELLANLFAPDINPADVSPEELKRLSKYARRFIKSYAATFGEKVNLKVAEAFFMQKVLPGHFDNFQQIAREMLGNPPEPPKIY
ncbi:MAG: PIG-L deacetylase family protein [Promethearchaeota archaeon]|jgi:LmbE family N-acetylglucosaminyl deacetylase